MLIILGKRGTELFVRFEQLQKIYQSPNGEIPALLDVTFSVERGAFVSIVGPSGCGKTTLLNILAGLEQPSGGRVLLGGRPVEGVSPAVGYMPQKDQLFPWRSIWGNVMLGLELQGVKSGPAVERVQALLARYGLEEFARKLPGQLSGGMRQRVALIRTLATDPELLLLDEPFSALDYQTRLAVSDDISRIIRQEGKTALLVTHDIAEAVSMSDRVVVLSRRPGQVKAVYDLEAMRGLGTMDRREHPEFQRYFNAVWKELDHGG